MTPCWLFRVPQISSQGGKRVNNGVQISTKHPSKTVHEITIIQARIDNSQCH